MTDYRTFFDKEYLGAWDLGGKDRVVTIESVRAGTVGGHSGKKKDRKPIITFVGKKKKFLVNATNAATIAALYGNHVEKWQGRRIAIHPTTTTFGRETVECIRVRPFKPGDGPDTSDDLDREVDAEAREKQNEAREAADD